MKKTQKDQLAQCERELQDTKTRLQIEVAQRTKSLEAEIARLKELSDSKDEFIRITNHELRTPLDVIRGNLDMVLKGEVGEILPSTKEYLDDALLGADRLTKLVNAMLDISRIETGRMRFTLEAIDLTDFLRKVENEFTPLAKEREISLYLKLPPEIPPIFSDRERLFQIIDNLLGNSLKFTPPGGAITIGVEMEDESAVISVQDTGIGIRPEDQTKLFKKFPQIDTGIAQVSKGTGLGLSLVWQLVEKLGGEVWVQSQGIGKGAVFSFRVPLAQTERAKALLRYHAVFLESGNASNINAEQRG